MEVMRMGRAQFILSASLMIGALLGESPFAFAQEKPGPAANVAPQASEKNSMIVTSDYYIGPDDIEATGLTPGQLTTNIVTKLKQFKETPTVSVILQQGNSYAVYVLGEVGK